MNNMVNSLSELQIKERQLKTLSEMIDKEGLAQCIRLLSTYIALYKKDFASYMLKVMSPSSSPQDSRQK